MKSIIQKIIFLGLVSLACGGGADEKPLSQQKKLKEERETFFPGAPTDSRLGFLKHVYQDVTHKLKGESVRRRLQEEARNLAPSSDCTAVTCKVETSLVTWIWEEFLDDPWKALAKAYKNFDWNPGSFELPCTTKFNNGEPQHNGALTVWSTKKQVFARARICVVGSG